MMDTHAQAQATTLAGYVRQALAVEGGHLFLGPNGAILHFAPGARARGFPCEAIKAASIAAGLPVIDCRAVPFRADGTLHLASHVAGHGWSAAWPGSIEDINDDGTIIEADGTERRIRRQGDREGG